MYPQHILRRRSFISLCHKFASSRGGSARSELFTYPGPFKLPNDDLILSPITLSTTSACEEVSVISELAGVIVMLYWSDISLTANDHDFGVLDYIISYWSRRSRNVIVGIVTVGYPINIGGGSKSEWKRATPTWVLDQIETYQQTSMIIGSLEKTSSDATVSDVFPVYWDPIFLERIEQLVRLLSRYDGTNTISSIRITTGITGEDNPTFDGLLSAMPRFSNLAWIRFSRSVVAIYRKWFRKTTLEFDIDRLGWIIATGRASDAGEARALIADLRRWNILLAMNGFDVENTRQYFGRFNTGPAESLLIAEEFHADGGFVGLETGTVHDLDINEVNLLIDGYKKVAAQRLVVLADFTASVEGIRGGSQGKNRLMDRVLTQGNAEAASRNSLMILNALNFVHF